MAGRRCPATRCPAILTHGERACPEHLAQYEAKRGTKAERGYGAHHQALRAEWQARIDTGEIVHCARGCGTRLAGRVWHLGHTDDRAGYIGPECVTCNTSAGGKASHRFGNERQTPRG